jgi:hypothetical protein
MRAMQVVDWGKPLEAANSAIQDLLAGKVLGRVVLKP